MSFYDGLYNGKAQAASGRGIRCAGGRDGVGAAEDMFHCMCGDAVAGVDDRYGEVSGVCIMSYF